MLGPLTLRALNFGNLPWGPLRGAIWESQSRKTVLMVDLTLLPQSDTSVPSIESEHLYNQVAFCGATTYMIPPDTPLASRVKFLVDKRAPQPVVIISFVIHAHDHLTNYAGHPNLAVNPRLLGVDMEVPVEIYVERVCQEVLRVGGKLGHATKSLQSTVF